MGRKPRREYYGAIYHIIQRGKDKKAIFGEGKDKEKLLEILSETKELYDFNIYAYVIMEDHCHLLLQTFNIPISKIMHRINTRYAKYYNFKRGRRGPVFEGRYRGILVENESYILDITRDIHRKPVVNNISRTMENYQWTSDIFYRINMKTIVDIDEILNRLSLDRGQAIDRYIDLMDGDPMASHTGQAIYERDSVIGSGEFKTMIMKMEEDQLLDLNTILEMACPKDEDYRLIKEGSRKRYLTRYKKAYAQLGKKSGYSYEEIGQNIGTSKAAIRYLLKGD